MNQVPVATKLDFNRLHLKLQAKGNGDIFFARHVLLTEGQDDKAVFAELLEKKGVDCSAKSISIVDCGGKAQIPDYVCLCLALGIDCYVVIDADSGNASSASATKKIQNALQGDAARFHEFPDTLEAALKARKSGSANAQQLLQIIESLDYAAIKNSYPEICCPIEEFVKRV